MPVTGGTIDSTFRISFMASSRRRSRAALLSWSADSPDSRFVPLAGRESDGTGRVMELQVPRVHPWPAPRPPQPFAALMSAALSALVGKGQTTGRYAWWDAQEEA